MMSLARLRTLTTRPCPLVLRTHRATFCLRLINVGIDVLAVDRAADRRAPLCILVILTRIIGLGIASCAGKNDDVDGRGFEVVLFPLMPQRPRLALIADRTEPANNAFSHILNREITELRRDLKVGEIFVCDSHGVGFLTCISRYGCMITPGGGSPCSSTHSRHAVLCARASNNSYS